MMIRGWRTHSEEQAGITLVELLVSMIILSIVTTMLIVGWIALQSSYAQSVNANDARSSARDALTRISSEIRGAQPSPLATAGSAVFTVANPMEVDFYSSYNQPGASADGTGTGALRLTRIYLDTSGSTPQKTLKWQRDTNNNGFDSDDRTMVLTANVANQSVPSTGSPTAIFTYGFLDAGTIRTSPTIPTASYPTATLVSIISVNIRLIVDANLNHAPAPVDLQTFVRPRNAPQS